MDRIDMIDDGMCCDDHDTQGRTPESVRGTEDNLYVLFKIGVAFVVALVLWLAWKAVTR